MLRRIGWMMGLALAAMGLAQEAPPAKQLVLGKQIFYAMARDIREELKLTEAQVKKITDAFQGSLTLDGDRIMVMMDPSLDMEECERQAVKVLDQSQTKRLQEIWIQELGAITMADESIAKALGLDESQKKAAQRILEDVAQSLLEIFSGDHNDGVAKKARTLRQKGSERAMELLTEDQKKIFEGMKGKAFKRKIDDIG